MNNKTTIMLVDFLFMEGGSFLDDAIFIKNCLADHDVIYKAFKKNDTYIKKMKNIINLYINPSHFLIILSSKLWILYLLIPITLFKKVAFVYHFIPNKKEIFHRLSMILFSRFFTVIVYSKALAEQIKAKWDIKSIYLPSRGINKQIAVNLLEAKLIADSNLLFVPGVRPGVRNITGLESILTKIIDNKRLKIGQVIIQSEKNLLPNVGKLNVKLVSKLKEECYKEIFRKSICVYIDFDEWYELRASGVVLDAIAAGCIIFTTAHPITKQYGFPNSLLTDFDSFDSLNELNDISEMIEQLDVLDIYQSKHNWEKFINENSIR